MGVVQSKYYGGLPVCTSQDVRHEPIHIYLLQWKQINGNGGIYWKPQQFGYQSADTLLILKDYLHI